MSNLLSFQALFAESDPFAIDASSPWFQIPIALLCAYFLLCIAGWRFAFKKLSFSFTDFCARKYVPWGPEAAFAVFLLFAFIAPALSSFALKAVPARFFPQFERSEIAKVEPASDSAVDSFNDELNATEEQESIGETTDAAESETTSSEIKDAEETAAAEEGPNEASEIQDGRDLSTQHPIARLFIRSKGKPYFPVVFITFVLATVIVAPIAEELVFRVVLQGACERAAFQSCAEQCEQTPEQDGETAAIPAKPSLWRVLLAILPPALLFALMHAGVPEDPNAPILVSKLFKATVSGIVGNLATVAAAVFFLRAFVRTSWEDFGLGALSQDGSLRKTLSRFASEFCRGAILYFYSMPFVYAAKIALQNVFPSAIVDPAPILVFALWEGFVYYKTRSLPTLVGMHMALNASSFLLLCMTVS